MILIFVAKLGLNPRLTHLGAHKIDDLLLKTYGIILAVFSIQNSWRIIHLFEATFLLANTSMEVVLKTFFLSLDDTNIEYTELKKLIWKFYVV